MELPINKLPLPATSPDVIGDRPAGTGNGAEEAAQGFASMFVKELLKSAMPSQAGGLFPPGAGGDYYHDIFLQNLADQIARSDGFPLARSLMRHLTRPGDGSQAGRAPTEA